MKSFSTTLKEFEAYAQGVQSGREMAVKQYDKAFIELSDKMDNIMRKLDEVLCGREK